MNAYELADQVEMWGEDLLALNMKGGIPVVEGAKMLRQQADRIAELEKDLHMVQRHYDQLNTHPVKQLSDEEIHNLMDEIEVLVHGDIKRAMYRMARKVESILNE